MRLLLLALLLSLCACGAAAPSIGDGSVQLTVPPRASAPPVRIIQTPIDAAARAKFPADPPAAIDALSFVNRLVNQVITPMSDQQQYGRADHWVMLPPSMKGDCEDYALSKLAILGESGFPTVRNARIRAVVVHRRGMKPEGHAILELRLPSGATVFLDNNSNDLATRADLVARGYEFIDW